MCTVVFQTHSHAPPYSLWQAPKYLRLNSGESLIHNSASLVTVAIAMVSCLPLDNAPWWEVWCTKDYVVASIIEQEMPVNQWPGKPSFKHAVRMNLSWSHTSSMSLQSLSCGINHTCSISVLDVVLTGSSKKWGKSNELQSDWLTSDMVGCVTNPPWNADSPYPQTHLSWVLRQIEQPLVKKTFKHNMVLAEVLSSVQHVSQC